MMEEKSATDRVDSPEYELSVLRNLVYETLSDEYSDAAVVYQGKRIVVTLATGQVIVVLVSAGRERETDV